MRVLKYNGVLFGVKKIAIDKNGFITIDGVSAFPPMTIDAETHTGFFALENLEPKIIPIDSGIMQRAVLSSPEMAERIEKYRHVDGKFYGYIWKDSAVLAEPPEMIKSEK
jgi:hypothetical protein